MPGHSWAVTLDTLGALLLAIHSELTLKTLLLQLLGGIQIPNFGHLLKCVSLLPHGLRQYFNGTALGVISVSCFPESIDSELSEVTNLQ